MECELIRSNKGDEKFVCWRLFI